MINIFNIVKGGIVGLTETVTNNKGKISKEVKQKLKIQENEESLHHFNCALQDTILLQGKLHVFFDKICFYSSFNNKNLVGPEKTYVTIKYDEIKRIQKKKIIGIPNTIHITLQNNKKYIFTSFLQRDKAFKAMKMYKDHQKGIQEQEELWLQEQIQQIEALKLYEEQQEVQNLNKEYYQKRMQEQQEELQKQGSFNQNNNQENNQISDLSDIYGKKQNPQISQNSYLLQSDNNNQFQQQQQSIYNPQKQDSNTLGLNVSLRPQKQQNYKEQEEFYEKQQQQSQYYQQKEQELLQKSILFQQKEQQLEQKYKFEAEQEEQKKQENNQKNDEEDEEEEEDQSVQQEILKNPLKYQKQAQEQWNQYHDQLNQIFKSRENQVNEIISKHDNKKNKIKWSSLILKDLSVREVYLLFFSNQQFEDGGKKYKNFFEFFMVKYNKEYNIDITEIVPTPPEIYQSLYTQNALQLQECQLSSSRHIKFTHPLEPSFLLPDKIQGKVRENLYWVTDNYFVLERFLNFQGMAMADSFEPRVIYTIKKTNNYDVELKTGFYIHFLKNTWFKSKIEKGALEENQKACKQLNQLFTRISEKHKRERNKNDKMMLQQKENNAFNKNDKDIKDVLLQSRLYQDPIANKDKIEKNEQYIQQQNQNQNQGYFQDFNEEEQNMLTQSMIQQLMKQPLI